MHINQPLSDKHKQDYKQLHQLYVLSSWLFYLEINVYIVGENSSNKILSLA